MEVVDTAGCVKGVSAIWACAPTPELGNGVVVQEGAKGLAMHTWYSGGQTRTGVWVNSEINIQRCICRRSSRYRANCWRH